MREFRKGEGVFLYRNHIDAYWPSTIIGVHQGEPLRLDLDANPVRGENKPEWIFRGVKPDTSDLLEDEPMADAPASARRESSAAARRPRLEEEEQQHEPTWVTAIAIVGAVIMVYGLMVIYSIAAEAAPSGITGIFAK